MPHGYAVLLLVLSGMTALFPRLRPDAPLPWSIGDAWLATNNGICFCLVALALLIGRPPQAWRMLTMRLCGLLLLIDALLVLPRMLAAPGARWEGGPAPLMTDMQWAGDVGAMCALAFAGAGLYFLSVRAPYRRLLCVAGMLLVVAMSLVDLLGWSSGVYSQFFTARAGGPAVPELWPMTAGLVAHGLATGGGRMLFRRRADRRIGLMGGAILFVVVTAVGVFVVSCSARNLVAMQESAQLARARHLADDFRHMVREAARELERQAGAAEALLAHPPHEAARMRTTFERMRTATQGRLTGLYRSAGGQVHTLAGAPWSARPEFEIPWRDGAIARLVLGDSLTLLVEHPAGRRRSLLLAANLDEQYRHILAAFGARHSGELRLCATGTQPGTAICLPGRRGSKSGTQPLRAADGQSLPMALALAGKTGTLVAADRRGMRTSMLHMPVTADLGLVVKLDGDAALALVRRQIWMAAPVILGLTLLGVFLFQRLTLAQLRRLLQRHAYSRAMFDQMPVALIVVDDQGLIADMNSQAERMFACMRHTACGMAAARLFPGYVLQDAHGGFRPTWGASQPVRGQRFGGESFDATIGIARYACQGRRCAVLMVTDMSHVLRQAQELDYWEQIFIHAEWGVLVVGADGLSLERMNQRFACMHGYSENELQGLPLLQVSAPAMRTPLAAHLALAQSRGRHSFESLHMRRDGSEFPVQVDVATVREKNGSVRCRVIHVQDISERKQLELALRNAENAQRSMLDSQRDLVFRWRPDFTLEYVNLTFAAAFGYLPGELLGKRWLDLMPAETRDALTARVAALVSQPRRLEYEARIRLECGTFVWFVWTHTPLFDGAGQLIGFQGGACDITASKEAALTMAESRGLLRALFDNRTQPSCLLALDGTVIRANRAMHALFGEGCDEPARLEIWREPWFHEMPELAERLRAAVACAAKGATDRLEITVCGEPGAATVYEIVCCPVFDQAGEAVRKVLAEWRDVTEVRRIELAATERDARLRAMAASLSGMVFEFRMERDELRPTYVSEGAGGLCGMRAEELVSGARRLIDCVHADDREGFATGLARCAQLTVDWNWTGRLAGAQQSEATWVNIRAKPRSAGRQVIWDAVALNITELKQKELEIDDSRQALRELSAHREAVREDERKYIAREIHDELGQNLTALRMGLAVLEARSALLPAATEMREDIARLKELADKSIGVVRSVATSLRPAALDMGLAAALTWLADEFQGRHGIACTLDLSGAPASLPDEMATGLFRIVQESLTNVSRHAVAHKVHVMLRQLGNHLVLEVRDDGVGFDSGTNSGRKGYGLMGMRERTLMLGGRINIVGACGQGTTISVSVPLKSQSRE
jgi:PAS domain S-box-containing protein